MDNLTRFIENDLKAVDVILKNYVLSSVKLIPEIAVYLINSGGKRLRPSLTLATAQLFNYQGDDHVKLAASVECMHTATLLHDDVVDESDLRRLKATARKIWGNQSSVLVGDFLLGKAFSMMVETRSLDCLEILSSAAVTIAEGEVMQLHAAQKLTADESAYLEMISAKTATLFAAACEVGAILADVDSDARAACRDYGQNLGMAFQLVDDALDYGGLKEKWSKNAGDDFREGKITLPLILAYKNPSAEERAFWQRTIEEGRLQQNDFKQALTILARYETLEQTRARANYYGRKARDALRRLPKNPLRDALEETINVCVSRES